MRTHTNDIVRIYNLWSVKEKKSMTLVKDRKADCIQDHYDRYRIPAVGHYSWGVKLGSTLKKAWESGNL